MAYGPVEYLALEFPGNQFKGEIAPALAEVVAQGLIRIIDLVFVIKDNEGNAAAIELSDLPELEAKPFQGVVDHISGLLSEQDILDLTATLPPNNAAALLVVEHLWSARFASAIREAKGQVVAQGYVPPEVVQAVAASRAEAAEPA